MAESNKGNGNGEKTKERLDAAEQRIAAAEQRIAELEKQVTALFEMNKQLTAKAGTAVAVAEAKPAGPPKPVTRAELAKAVKTNPHVQLRVLTPFQKLGHRLTIGQVIRASDLGTSEYVLNLIEADLQVAIAA